MGEGFRGDIERVRIAAEKQKRRRRDGWKERKQLG
jgi:hypothetical protein